MTNPEARQIAENDQKMAQGWAAREKGEVYNCDISVAVASAEHLARLVLALEARCGRYREALEWYATADVGEYVAEGEGAKARTALTDGGQG